MTENSCDKCNSKANKYYVHCDECNHCVFMYCDSHNSFGSFMSKLGNEFSDVTIDEEKKNILESEEKGEHVVSDNDIEIDMETEDVSDENELLKEKYVDEFYIEKQAISFTDYKERLLNLFSNEELNDMESVESSEWKKECIMMYDQIKK